MKKTIIVFSLFSLICGLTACDENQQFEGELYKKVIYVLSDDDLVFQSEHQLGEESIGYVTIYCGGTEHINQDVTVELEPDDDVLGDYNYRYFDLDESKYAVLLPEENYTIESYATVLKADVEDNYSLLPIKIRPDGLSPDQTYMLPLKVKSISDYELNPQKQQVLFNVMLKNDYASTLTTTYYQTTGREVRNLSSGDVTTAVSVTRPVVPINKNTIRMFAGRHTYVVGSIDLEERDKYAINVTFNEDSTLTISPYANIEVEQIGGPEDNYYFINQKTAYLTLVMNYRYKDTVTVDGQQEECWITMSEQAVYRTSTSTNN